MASIFTRLYISNIKPTNNVVSILPRYISSCKIQSKEDNFFNKHVNSNKDDEKILTNALNLNEPKDIINKTLPTSIQHLVIDPNLDNNVNYTENQSIEYLKNLMDKNKKLINCYGEGFYPTITPFPIKKYVLNNPNWYTAYTPYQAEISQGRLELLFLYQKMIADITNLPLANAGLLDEASSGAEAATLFHRFDKNAYKKRLCVSSNLFDTTVEAIKTRCKYLNIPIDIIDETTQNLSDINWSQYFGLILQYPDKNGNINLQLSNIINDAKDNGCQVACATDLMSNFIYNSPGLLGADVAFGNTQRFGLPLGFGGPHVAFFSTNWKYLRHLPGKLASRSKDKNGKYEYRLALQTREQHIKKEKSTSNICTSQVLLSNLSCLYGLYHGEKNLMNISIKIKNKTSYLVRKLYEGGISIDNNLFYDTIKISNCNASKIYQLLLNKNYLVKLIDDKTIRISMDEKITYQQIKEIANIIIDNSNISILSNYCNMKNMKNMNMDNIDNNELLNNFNALQRTSDIFTEDIFKNGVTETDLMRYIKNLEKKDYSLTDGMIPLGSCTMKLNAAYQLEPLNWESVADIHPNTPHLLANGYHQMIRELSYMLLKITGMDDISYQSASGAMGEYSGLITINKYLQKEKGEEFNSDNPLYCLIPESAHGTNFSSARLAGYKILKIKSKNNGEICMKDLNKNISKAGDKLGCLMITYPSTYGFFDENILQVVETVHNAGGQVYLDGANLNAMVGLIRIGDLGVDVSHMNLHKTFCIPHGGGGPGMGPIVVKNHLIKYLPTHYNENNSLENIQDSSGLIASSPFASSSILTIPYLYLKCMSLQDLQNSTIRALINSNYLKNKLENDFRIKYMNENGYVAHEFIIDFHKFNKLNISEKDIAKRLIDYSFHPPTMSWPVPNSLMIEPTESESLYELDRFVKTMKSIKEEIVDIEQNKYSMDNNVLVNSPHSLDKVISGWDYPYNPEKAYYPISELKERKHFPPVGRVNDILGDKELLKKMNK
jgi:glycine dehydrogenase